MNQNGNKEMGSSGPIKSKESSGKEDIDLDGLKNFMANYVPPNQ